MRNHVVDRNPAILEIDIGGKRQPGDGVELTGSQHRLADRDTDVLDRDRGCIDAVGLDKNPPLRKSRVGGGCAERLAFEVFTPRLMRVTIEKGGRL
jgi:hypothetical protein